MPGSVEGNCWDGLGWSTLEELSPFAKKREGASI